MPDEAPRPERDEANRLALELTDHYGALPPMAVVEVSAGDLHAVLARLAQAERALATERTAREEAERLAEERLEALRPFSTTLSPTMDDFARARNTVRRAAAFTAAEGMGGPGGR